ncbi:exodeoxyribonuclease V subunit gamma [Thalassotalea sp. G2M2-11]|uniref:exodeoxyribonuclease V subunit gamma n=1 Tax=Thalassotalea sp. G2M2-11 TaxID=2787627 RepID=UPI0019D1FA95|nr:exodeoxyribonuclease V subunit gamma [Thalassotalea sp. G2M2-11]
MENLLALVDKIQQVSPLPIFAKETFIVQNAGIQHWLNMSLAEQRGISLNIDYALPAQYLWKLLRNIVNDGGELEQAPFSREALCWRIYQLLADEEILNHQAFSSVTHYWYSASQRTPISQTFTEQDNLKRYQLACQLADLYEQYLIFRPDWIDAWHQGELINEKDCLTGFDSTQQWQALLWQLLTKEQAYNPRELIEQAIASLAHNQQYLPKRLSFFGINAMPPMWLSFIHALSEHIDVHFFHLNPCFSYWGDIVTEKQAVKMLDKWTQGYQDISASVGNPLLANLGQQGREFLALLQQYSHVNIDAFSTIESDDVTDNKKTVLAHIQDDILALTDARIAPKAVKDDSIVITSAHSTLREVQGVHDWLLHQFNQNPSLTPKDVVIMCPQVEQYAPYVNAVFAQGWQEIGSDVPPLPCSIADRVSKDADPLVAAFSELLTLPDSRFQVSQILSWLRIPAMQQKFDLTIEDLDKITVWVEQASIHWGIDQTHKQQLLDNTPQTIQFTWQYGLARLLEGFAYSSTEAIYNDKLVLPLVEGSDAVLLGKLMLVIEQLQYFSASLNTARDPVQWQRFLHSLLEELFASQTDDFNVIYQAIEHLVEYCHHAEFNHSIPLSVVKEFLEQHFSQPDPGRQFMVGQVTFCSMLPMRSIPFKVVAILGLNDGEYPRQRQPLGFDLMSLASSRLGDRSRRGDDRYLFLEALISARNNLYLSYQGRNVRNNAIKQPSIVLKELMDYLSVGYGWQLTDDDAADIRQLALQPYSEKNYQGEFASFDSNWLALNQQMQAANNNHQSSDLSWMIEEHHQANEFTLSVKALLAFFQHPSRYFAQQVLSLYLDEQQQSLIDDEPFSCDHLTSYLYKQHLVNELLKPHHVEQSTVNIKPSVDEQHIVALQASKARLSGKLPDLPHTDDLLDKLNDDSLMLFHYISQSIDAEIESADLSVVLNVPSAQSNEPIAEITVTTRIYFTGSQLVYYRPSSPKAKDFMQQYLDLLLLQSWQQRMVGNENLSAKEQRLLEVDTSHGYYFDTKNQCTKHFCYQSVGDAKQLLVQLLLIYCQGQKQPLLLNGALAEKYYKAKRFEQLNFEQFWYDDYYGVAFGDDPYIRYFWQQCPELETILPPLQQVYQTLFTDVLQVNQ